MTDQAFISALAKETNLPKIQAKHLIDSVEIVLKRMVGEEKIRVADLTFSVKDVVGRNLVHPVTKEIIEIPPAKKLHITPSIDFKAIINGDRVTDDLE